MAILYVSSGSTGNGSSWNNAFGTLQSAIAAAQAGDQIWVAGGTYTPGTERTDSFVLQNDVAIYGGFAGTETSLNQRDINNNVTILSGDIGTVGDDSDNSYHVVRAEGSFISPISTNTLLDGFTISDGNANGSTDDGNGGGVFLDNANPTLSNIIFTENNATNGGGLYSENGSNPILTNTTFEFNTATNGAAIYNDLSSPQITNGTFRLNVANNSGGAIFNTSSSNPTIINSVFSRNSANTSNGGAVFNNLSNPNFINSSFSGNVAVTGGAISNSSSSVSLNNSILWGNNDSSNTGAQIAGTGVTANNSIIQGGQFGATNEDPLFVDAKNDDLRLNTGSPGLDAGNQSLLPADSQDIDGDGNTTERIPLDLSGNSRVSGTEIDLGTYEGVAASPAPDPADVRIFFVRGNAGGDNDGSSWVNAFTDLQDALAVARSGDQIWVAAGTYTPTDGTDRNASFVLKNHVEVYGGFVGTETSLNQRDIVNNVTILSGEIGDTETIDDNSYTVVNATRTTNTTVLDGFTITGGNASVNTFNSTTGIGGGMLISDGSPTLNNLIFDNNRATYGGGLFNNSGANPILTNVTFRNNTATAQGGAVYNYFAGNPTFNEAIFTNNTATNEGGAVLNYSSNPTFNDVTFASNSAANGGAMYSQVNSDPIVNQGIFANNTVTGDGGAVYQADNSFQFTDVTFAQNQATSEGGAIYQISANGSTITEGTFTRNTAVDGGAIYHNFSQSFSLTNITFNLNSATTNGGAIYNFNTLQNNLQLTNAVFSRNNAGNRGGAIYQLDTSNNNSSTSGTITTITNSSFSGNSAASGSAIRSDGFDSSDRINTTIRNSIIWGNAGTALSINSSSLATFNAGDTNIIQDGQFGGVNQDPLFVDAINDDLRLRENSPAIDLGNQTNLPTDTSDLDGDGDTSEATPIDLDGATRVVGENVDAGAFEFATNAAPVIEDQSFSTVENIPLNTIIGQIAVTDNNNDALTYTITSGNPNLDGDETSGFSIDAEGRLRVADPDDLDFETNPSNALTVEVSDGELSDTATITVNLTDDPNEGNQPPQITDQSFTLAQDSSNGDAVGTVSATDPEGDSITYSITNGNPNIDGDGTSAFTINPGTGLITVADTDDFGTTTQFNLEVTATDNGDPSRAGTGNITVNLAAVNLAPVVNNANFTLDDNPAVNQIVGTVSATDPNNDTLTYTITNGNPNLDNDGTSAFNIDSSGTITVIDPDDIDFLVNPNLNLTVTVSDGNLSDTAQVSIIGEGIPTVNPINNISVAESITAGDVVIAAADVTATDPDTPVEDLTFAFSSVPNDNNGNNLFAIDATTGEVTITQAGVDNLNFTGQTQFFNLGITASDGVQVSSPETVQVLANTQPTTVEIVLYQDNNGALGDVIESNEAILGDNFFVEINLGDIRTDAAGLVAAALDLGFAADVAQNIDDFSSLASILTNEFPLFQTGTVNNTTGTIDNLGAGALPPDNGSAIGVNSSERFALLRFSTTDDRDDSQIVLDLDASQTGYADGLFADPSNTQFSRTLIINDAPELDAIADTTLSENAAAGTVVVAGNLVIANDDQFGNTPTFSLNTSPTDGNGDALFAIDENTGEITLTQAGVDTIDFESGVTSYNLGVTASDGFKTSTEETFTVSILNENEAIIKVFLPNGEEADGINDITFTTELSRFRTDVNGDPVADSEFIRPNFADTFKFIDILNDTMGDEDILQITDFSILGSLTGVSIDAPEGDTLINPGETKRFFLTYAPNQAGESFDEGNGLTIISNATNDPSFEINLAGKSTFNSDISYDGQVNLTDLGTLQSSGLFGSENGQSNYDPTADITGDGRINLAELVPLNAEFGSSVL
ncbi:cadherin domain-containing protein [Crocosphaera sp.]|uniref:beta strand repeat-containing protein n=1 Tax=Crocosphaera sp. TaxID=2729996 RepID=UPI00260B6BC0|nr:cadherin domain-containing protein [Crocosphaera sp.]MDJ0582558.1 cadherin domain-containing protein [Crocosphaera sp.]